MQTVGAAGIPACGIAARKLKQVTAACSAAGKNARSSYC